MAYTPYEWTVNSYLNPTRMNAIEQGIAAASQAAESASGEFHTIEELIGTQSIAGIGDGTLTGATWKINNDLSDLKNTVTTLNSNFTNLGVTKIKHGKVTIPSVQANSWGYASVDASGLTDYTLVATNTTQLGFDARVTVTNENQIAVYNSLTRTVEGIVLNYILVGK